MTPHETAAPTPVRATAAAPLDPMGLAPRRAYYGWNNWRILLSAVIFSFAAVTTLHLLVGVRILRPVPLAIAGVITLNAFAWMVFEFRRRHGVPNRRPPQRVLRRRVRLGSAGFVLTGVVSFGLMWAWLMTRYAPLLPVAATGIALTLGLHAWLRWQRRRLRVPWTDPVRVRSTAFGIFHFLLTLGLGVVALQTGLNLLIGIFAVMLTLIVVSGLLTSTNFHKLRVERDLPPEVVAGQPTTVQVRVRNRKRWLPSYSAWLQEGWPAGVAAPDLLPSAYALRVPPRGETRLTYDIVFPERGVFRFVGFSVMSRFPFSMFARYCYLTQEQEVVVLPPLDRLPPDLVPAATMPSNVAQRRATNMGTGDVRGVRGYVPGLDDVNAIHWPTTARLGEPMVREREREAAGARWVVLERGEHGAVFERGIALAAALVHEAWRQQVPVTLVLPPEPPVGLAMTGLAHRRACLTALARLRGYRGPAYVEPAEPEHVPETSQPLPARQRERDEAALAAGPSRTWALAPGTTVVALATASRPAFAAYVTQAVPRTSRVVWVDVAQYGPQPSA